MTQLDINALFTELKSIHRELGALHTSVAHLNKQVDRIGPDVVHGKEVDAEQAGRLAQREWSTADRKSSLALFVSIGTAILTSISWLLSVVGAQ